MQIFKSSANQRVLAAIKKRSLLLVILAFLLVMLIPAGLIGKSQETAAAEVTVSDPQVLTSLWEEYIQEGITSIFNRPFDKPEDLERNYAIQYAVRTISRKDACSIDENGYGLITPQLTSEYIKRYFNTDLNDIDPQKDYRFTAFYNPEMQAFDTADMNKTRFQGKYDEMNPWGTILDSVTHNQETGTYRVKLVHYASNKGSRVSKEIYCILKERSDGSLYFESVSVNYPNSEKLLKFDGKYNKLDPVSLDIKSDNPEGPIQVLADFEGRIFVRSNNGNKGNEYEDILRIWDEKTLKEISRISSRKDFKAVKQLPDGYLLITQDSRIKLDLGLNKIYDKELPDAVKKAYNGDWQGGFDVSRDGRFYVYSVKEQGLVLYDEQNNSENVLTRHRPRNAKFEFVPYILEPVFVDGDTKVVAKILGYESIGGYVIVDLKTGQVKPLTVETGSGNTINAFDSHLPAAYGVSAVSPKPDGKKPQEINIARMDYGEMKIDYLQFVLADHSQNQPEPEINPVLLQNDRYLAYISCMRSDKGDRADDMSYIVRLDLHTMRAETLLSIKAGFANLLGMLDDGRVIFFYSFENINGIGIASNK